MIRCWSRHLLLLFNALLLVIVMMQSPPPSSSLPSSLLPLHGAGAHLLLFRTSPVSLPRYTRDLDHHHKELKMSKDLLVAATSNCFNFVYPTIMF
mmetsp:Transcript_42725/g.68818  ORF Transcript_42725/g.68818 Transcript_42725/m.68818 type:complete len:95 (+) Transcript_42725:211-495(+)